ncbi:MAG: cytochrome c maturation protein CcmE [Gammaproteobacteria bacterium]
MNAQRRKLLCTVIFVVAGMGLATALALKAFQQNLLYFYSPAQVAKGEAPVNRPFRVGGLVVAGSVVRDPESLTVKFVLTDTLQQITVEYDGILPDLFREGQGIVANGRMRSDGTFAAAEVLAKHDENYMPKEVADALKDAGVNMPYRTHDTAP